MYNFIKKVMIVGLFEKGNDYLIDFEKGSNCLFGDNGTGKTTLINLIVGSLMADLPALMEVRFEYLSVTVLNELNEEKEITVYKSVFNSSHNDGIGKNFTKDLFEFEDESLTNNKNESLYNSKVSNYLDDADFVTIVYDLGDEEASFKYPSDEGRAHFNKRIRRGRRYQILKRTLSKLINLTHVPLLRMRQSESFFREHDDKLNYQYEKEYFNTSDNFTDPSTSVLIEIERNFKRLARVYSSTDTSMLEGFKSQIVQKFLVDKESMRILPRIASGEKVNDTYVIDELIGKLSSAGLDVPEEKLIESFEVLNDLSEKAQKALLNSQVLKESGATPAKLDRAQKKSSEFFIKMLVARTLFERFESVLEDVENLESERESLWVMFGDYEQLVNQFLNNKFFKVTKDGEFRIISGTRRIQLSDLSSGEKHIIAILGRAALSKDKGSVFIADEPELSLHLTWQRKMLPSILALSPKSQIIVATHSPAIIPKNANKIDLGDCR